MCISTIIVPFWHLPKSFEIFPVSKETNFQWCALHKIILFITTLAQCLANINYSVNK